MPRKSNKQGVRNYDIKGGVKAGGDVVFGDQNISIQNISNIRTGSQFVEELQKLQAEIARLKREPTLSSAEKRRVEVVEADIQDAIEEAKKPTPLATRINKTLDGAKETMDKLSGSIGTAMTFGATFSQLAELALKVFGP